MPIQVLKGSEVDEKTYRIDYLALLQQFWQCIASICVATDNKKHGLRGKNNQLS